MKIKKILEKIVLSASAIGFILNGGSAVADDTNFPEQFDTPVLVQGLQGYDVRASDISNDCSRMLMTIWNPARMYDSTWNESENKWNSPQDLGFRNWDGYATFAPNDTTMFYCNHGILYRSLTGNPPGEVIPMDRSVSCPFFTGERLYFDFNGDIYYSEYNAITDTFGSSQLANISTSEWGEAHPYVTPYGDLLFTSDRPGGYGGSDIWSESLNGIFNLGPMINTSGHEDNPFYCSTTKTLYFNRGIAEAGKLYQATGISEPSLEALIDIDPNTLNLASRGKWITGYIELPKDYSPFDIDPSTVYFNYNNEYIQAETLSAGYKDHNQNGILEMMIKFNREDIRSILVPGEVDVGIYGLLYNETPFYGRDIIRVINK